MDGPTFHLSLGDAVAWLRSLPSESIDLVVTDPPYESLEKHRAIGTTTRLKHSKSSSNDWFSIFPNARFPELFEQVYRVLKRNTHFYLYCDPETMFVAKPLAEAAGFKFWKPIVWDKCLAPDTLVWTDRGVRRIEDIEVGDRVAIPEGGTTEVRATRRTRAVARRFELSDGTQLVASLDHRLMKDDGSIVEARTLDASNRLLVYHGKSLAIMSVEEVGEVDLVDISIAHRDELFLLANGVVSHNCSIGMGYHYRARYECILFFEKGKRKLNDLGIPDILEAKRITGGYPAEKPSSVSETLIKQSTEIGQLVVDPFMGSGSVGLAAVTLGRSFWGNDLCAEAVDITRGRLKEAGAREVGEAVAVSHTTQLGLL